MGLVGVSRSSAVGAPWGKTWREALNVGRAACRPLPICTGFGSPELTEGHIGRDLVTVTVEGNMLGLVFPLTVVIFGGTGTVGTEKDRVVGVFLLTVVGPGSTDPFARPEGCWSDTCTADGDLVSPSISLFIEGKEVPLAANDGGIEGGRLFRGSSGCAASTECGDDARTLAAVRGMDAVGLVLFPFLATGEVEREGG